MNWESVEKRKLSWSEIWGMESNRLSFIIRETYDVLPSPINLQLWFGKDPSCPLCTVPATLKHISVGCRTSLTQGRYTWRHNQVLRCLAAKVECKRKSINAQPFTNQEERQFSSTFVQEGDKPRTSPSTPHLGLLKVARDWQMQVDLDQRLIFPTEIMQVDLDRRLIFPTEIKTTTLRPDLVLWSTSQKLAYVIELTVPWEEAIEEAFERKKLQYANLAAEAEDRSWKIKVRPVEVGCRGFVASITEKLLREIGIRGKAQRQAMRELANTAERTSHWLLLKRTDITWAAKAVS
ncbi:proto-oncogene serine/threonine-protein kinase Pim-1 [Sarotherodon galilaeus]